MFASSMKILTLKTNNASPTTAQSDCATQPVSKVLNSANYDEIGGSKTGSGLSHKNKREQKYNKKTKFVHGNSNKVQQHLTQPHLQTQKYYPKNSNNNNNSNNLKPQHYCNNSNNNNTSSANRKKYFQQQQQQQQQHQHYQQQHHYIAAVQKPNKPSPTNAIIANNNNSNLVKNHNYSNNELFSQQQKPKQQQLQHSNIVKNLVNFSTNLTEACTCLLQQNNCDELPMLSLSPTAAPEATSKTIGFLSHNIYSDNRLKSSVTSISQTSLSNEVQTTANKLPQNLEPATSTHFERNNTKSLARNCGTNENLSRIKSSIDSLPAYSELPNISTSSSSVLKRKSWKNSNTSAGVSNASGTEVNRCLSSGYSLGNTKQSNKLPNEKHHNVSDNGFTVNGGKNLGKNTNQNCNEEKYSTQLATTASPTQQTQISKNQIQTKDKIEMTTSLSASSKTSFSCSTNTLTSKTSTQSSKHQQKTVETSNGTNQMLKTPANSINCNDDINKTTTTDSPSATNTSSVMPSQNSYSLDFLHSVGVKMSAVTLRSPETQGTMKTYENQVAMNSPVNNACSYTGTSTNQRQPRYMCNGSNTNSSNNGNQLHHYHHHQPSQLTIASFLHKDFLGGGKASTSTTNNRGHSSSNSRSTSQYHDRQQQHHYTHQQQHPNARYHHNYNAAGYQQQTAVIQHTNYGGGYNGGHRSSGYGYTNYQNTSDEHGMGKCNTMTQLPSRQFKNNIVNFKNSVNNSQVNKKTVCTSSTTSNGSISSTKMFSSNSSNVSNRQLQTVVNQDSNKSSSNLNLAIETLPSKMLNGSNQRGSYRGHHNNHYGHHHGNPHFMMNSPNILQHQNYYNLTYVTTDASVNSAVSSRGCSPAPQSLPPTTLPAKSSNSPKTLDQSPGHAATLMNFNTSQLQYHRYQHNPILAAQQQQQYHLFSQQQQTSILNKKVIVPLSLSMPPPSPSPTLTSNSHQTEPHNIICCSQLDKASTAAAAAAVSSSSSSGIIAGSDYDSDNSSNQSSTQVKTQSIKSSISSSSSSLISSTSMKPQLAQQNICHPPATAVNCTHTTPLHSPIDYCGASSKVFSNMQGVQQHPQLTQFYSNNGGRAVISLLNMPTNGQDNFLKEDYLQKQQPVLSATSNQRSPDYFNIAALNQSNNSSGYWSPPFQNNQFIYHQIPSTQTAVPQITSSSSSCGSSSASMSPRLPNDDMQQQTYQRVQNDAERGTGVVDMSPSSCPSSLNEQLCNFIIGNCSNSELVVVGSSSSSNSSVSGYSNNGDGIGINSTNGVHNPKRSSSQLIAQQKLQVTCQSSSSSASSSSNGTVSTLTSAVRAFNAVAGEGEVQTNNGCKSQLISPSLNSAATLFESSISGSQHMPATTQNFYSHYQSLPPPLPPHNLLYNNPQVSHHMRALSSSSSHDSFAHTPPDRFLARAHLIEAKEAPASLLNNSKWDHLSQGIWDKFINSQQTEETFKQKMRLWRYLYLFIKNTYPRYGLYLVGSTISGFGSDSSDVDMCLVSRNASSIDPRLEALFNLTVLRDCLNKSGQFENFNLIEAKVPILRFSDRMNQLEVDLNFNNCVGIKNTHLLYCYSQLDWRLRPLVLVIKLWAQCHDINNAKNMTISSYSLVLMVIHFLQYAVNPPVLPCLHRVFPEKFTLLRSNDFGYVDMSETMGPYESKNNQTIGELFLSFLKYYSCFNYTEFAISVRTGGLLPINECRVAKSIKNDVHQWKELCIEEPFDLTNTARSVYDFETFERVKAVFSASWRILHETLDLNSVFSTILLSLPSATESSNLHRNTNSAIYPTPYHGIAVTSSGTELNFEQYEKDFRISAAASEEYKEHTPLSLEYNIEDSVLGVDDDYNDDQVDHLPATNNSLTKPTSAGRNMCKLKNLNRTLTPRQVEESPFSPTSPSSSTSFKTGTKNINENNTNNKTVSALVS